MLGGGEKLQPIVQYKPQRTYNRSAIGITRMFLTLLWEINMYVDIYVVLLCTIT